MVDPDPKSHSPVIGETKLERTFDHYFGNAIHFFLSLLAVLVLVAAAIATVDTMIYDVPQLWRQPDAYPILHKIIQNVLLVGIAAEFGLLSIRQRPPAFPRGMNLPSPQGAD